MSFFFFYFRQPHLENVKEAVRYLFLFFYKMTYEGEFYFFFPIGGAFRAMMMVAIR
jgi:hypothetical protein